MNERGFAFAALLGSPTAWLALGCALLAGTTWLMYGRWQAAVERTATVKGEYAAFVEAVKQRGLEAERENARVVEAWRSAVLHVKTRAAADSTRLRAHLDSLRKRPPERPDRSEVPVTTCGPGGPDATAAESVPLADYRALEARAASDALQLVRLQEWVRAIGAPIE